ncbi:hypothetical protein ABDB91_19135 [Desulfoscipio sp. XC116]|uniref:hypothetical protein n=1 Tax=Desulfoscipio sp. XC116 TaxID=3144975 RepID=UPI00325BA5A7
MEPILCEEEQADENGVVLKQVLEAEQLETFVKVFDKFPRVKEIYPIPNGPKVVFDEKQAVALEQINFGNKLSITCGWLMLKIYR